MTFAHSTTLDDPSTNDAHFGADDGRCTEVIQMEFSDLVKGPMEFLENCRSIVGYSFVQGNALRRKLPLRHPMLARMVAERISGWKFKGYQSQVQTPFGQVASYKRAEVTVSFRKPPYVLASDQVNDRIIGSGKERFRYCTTKHRTTTKIVSSDKEDFSFLVTPASVGGGKQKIKQGLPRPIAEGSYTITWYQVPRAFLYGATAFNRIAVNLVARVGRVNHQEFDGYPPGSLLMEDPEIKEDQGPLMGDAIWPSDGEIAGATFTVAIPFKVLRHKLANAGDKGNATKAGHNARVHEADGLAYPVGESTSEKPPFGLADMTQLFEIMNPELDPADLA